MNDIELAKVEIAASKDMTSFSKLTAIQALQEKLERENPQPLMIPVEQVAEVVEIISDNGGCPPDKDCPDGQNCAECIIEWLNCRYGETGTMPDEQRPERKKQIMGE